MSPDVFIDISFVATVTYIMNFQCTISEIKNTTPHNSVKNKRMLILEHASLVLKADSVMKLKLKRAARQDL